MALLQAGAQDYTRCSEATLIFSLRILQEVSRGFTYLRISVVGGDVMGTLQEIEDQGMNLQNRKDCDSTYKLKWLLDH